MIKLDEKKEEVNKYGDFIFKNKCSCLIKHFSNFVARKNDKSTSENVTNLRFKKTEMMEC